MQGLASAAVELLFSALAPPRCAACDEAVALLAAFCPACASTAENATSATLPDQVAAFVYGGALARAVIRFKYERRPDLGRPLGDLLWRAVRARVDASAVGPGEGGTDDLSRNTPSAVVVPVPLHPVRLAERGFNQSALLAARVARGLGVPVWSCALARSRTTAKQTILDREARRGNVAGAFSVRDPARVSGRRILLVDDVRTTGATLDACSAALTSAGAVNVGWAVLAQATSAPAGAWVA